MFACNFSERCSRSADVSSQQQHQPIPCQCCLIANSVSLHNTATNLSCHVLQAVAAVGVAGGNVSVVTIQCIQLSQQQSSLFAHVNHHVHCLVVIFIKMFPVQISWSAHCVSLLWLWHLLFVCFYAFVVNIEVSS